MTELNQLYCRSFFAKFIFQKQNFNKLKLQGDFFTEQLAQYEDIDFFALSDDEKKKIANELIERILLSEVGTIKIIWKI